MAKLVQKFLSILTMILIVVPVSAYADFSDILANINVPVNLGMNIFKIVLWIFGGLMILSSFIQYHVHRKNPSQVTLIKPIVLLITGIVFILLPFLLAYAQIQWANSSYS